MACLITASVSLLNHAERKITLTFTTSGTKVVLHPTAGDDVDLEDVTAAMITLHNPADTEGTYDAASSGNEYDDASIVEVISAGAKTVTVRYVGELEDDKFILGFLGYAVYDDAGTAAEYTGYSQDVFDSDIAVITPVQIAGWNNDATFAPAAINAGGGAMITPTKKDESCMLIIQNTGSGENTLTMYAGDGSYRSDKNLTFTLAASALHAMIIETAMFKFFFHPTLKGAFYFTGSAELKLAFVQMI